MRTEQDKLGFMEIEDDTLYGIQTARAMENFNISRKKVNHQLIRAILITKKAAAMTHKELGSIEEEKADYIIAACDDLLSKDFIIHFPTNALQGGAGTSTNMNVNEVIANTALLLSGRKAGDYSYIHPLDHVNKSQSTNDVYPTALRIAAVDLVRNLSNVLSKLQESLQQKELEFETIKKLGRTELMDALPITLGQEFGAYAQAISRDRWRIYKVEERLRQVNLGGTAIGTGSNADRRYTYKVVEQLRDLTGIGLARAEYPIDLTQNNDVFVEVSGLLKACAVNLMKISNDLRLMNSGPKGGYGEITLEPLQAGSTIMPGKVNPVIPEMVTQIAIQVMANDSAISFASASGQFELNAFMPLIADNLLESLELLVNGITIFRTKCIETILPNEENCRKHLDASTVYITALVPYIGYSEAEKLSVECHGNPEKIKALLLEKGLLDLDSIEEAFLSASTYLPIA